MASMRGSLQQFIFSSLHSPAFRGGLVIVAEQVEDAVDEQVCDLISDIVIGLSRLPRSGLMRDRDIADVRNGLRHGDKAVICLYSEREDIGGFVHITIAAVEFSDRCIIGDRNT